MRELTDHIVTGDSALQLKVTVLDEPGAGGACHDYRISGTFPKGSPLLRTSTQLEDAVLRIHPDGSSTSTLGRVRFQNGPIKEAGVNGVTEVALLTILIDRLRCFQAGPFACEENALALLHAEGALAALHIRTKRRILRGVEGWNVK